MDLDNEELEATRKLNGLAKDSNIEEDIKNVKKYIELVINKNYCDCNELNVISGRHCDGSKNVAYSMQNILAEREADKNKIRKLQEKLLDMIEGTETMEKEKSKETAEYIKENYIPVQKVKDKIEELKEQGNYRTNNNLNGRVHFMKEETDYKIQVLEEILEDK